MNLTAALISLGSKSSKMTALAMQNYFKVVNHLNIKNVEVNLGVDSPEILYKGKPIEKYDCVFPKGSFRYAPLLRAIASLVPKNTYTPINPEAYSIGHDKILTQQLLQQNNIPMPKTYLTSSPAAAHEILEKINYPIIMKFPQGTQGKGVMVADSLDSASSMMDALSALRQPFLIQEYVETGGVDIRAIVVGNEVVASMKRKAVKGETRANIHAGAKGEPCQLDAYTRKIAVEAAKCIGADICGVDILESAKGPVVIELNVSPGLQGITAATKIDVADKIARYLFEQTKQLKESGKNKTSSKIFKDLGITEAGKELLMNLDFRGNRILLPEIITSITKFDEKDEVTIKAEKKRISISKFEVGE